MDFENDGRFPDGSDVLVRFPRTPGEADSPRESWPWLPGTVIRQCGDDEWDVLVEADELATAEDDGSLSYPACFRDASEIKLCG